MKSLKIILLLAINLLILRCQCHSKNDGNNSLESENKKVTKSETNLNIEPKPMDRFEEFKKKKKFVEDMSIYYPGISDSTQLFSLT